jgi:hypothetical protein
MNSCYRFATHGVALARKGFPTRSLLGGALLSVLVLLAGNGHCTSIVAVKTAKEIYIGADSRVLIENDVPISQCKITPIGDVHIVFTGMPVLIKSKFNAYDIAGSVFTGTGSISDRINAYDKAIHKKLEQAFDAMRLSDAKFFSRWYAPDVANRVALQVLVAGSEKGTPVLSLLEYRITSGQQAPVAISSIRKDIITNPASKWPKILFLGMQDAINELLGKKDYFENFSAVKSINEWILAEAKANPAKVSPPVDILRIDGEKTEWVQLKTDCGSAQSCPSQEHGQEHGTQKVMEKAKGK